MQLVAEQASAAPLSFGAALLAMTAMQREPVQLIVVTAEATDASGAALISVARGRRDADVTCVVTEVQASALAQAGFELFQGRRNVDGRPTAYLCLNFVCRLPTTDAAQLSIRR
jgi:uncharacterized protein YyaL (SSP411 family)